MFITHCWRSCDQAELSRSHTQAGASLGGTMVKGYALPFHHWPFVWAFWPWPHSAELWWVRTNLTGHLQNPFLWDICANTSRLENVAKRGQTYVECTIVSSTCLHQAGSVSERQQDHFKATSLSLYAVSCSSEEPVDSRGLLLETKVTNVIVKRQHVWLSFLVIK